MIKKGKIIISWILILAMVTGYSSKVFAAQAEDGGSVSNNAIEIGTEVPNGNTDSAGTEGTDDGDTLRNAGENQEAEEEVQQTQTEEEEKPQEQQKEADDDSGMAADSDADTEVITETVSDGEEAAKSVSSNETLPESISENTLAVGAASVNYLSVGQSSYTPYWDNGNYSNLIVFVDFSDTTHNHPDSPFGVCYQTDTTDTFRYFNGSEEYPRGMRQYYYNISYGQLRVENIFPQYDSVTDTITPYTLSGSAAYYANNRDAMVEEIITLANNSGQLSSKMQLDLHNGDGILDNLTIVVACEEGNRNSLFSGVKTTYPGEKRIDGKLVRSYNLITEMGVYFALSNSGVIIHEFGHTLGYPDLYRSGTTSGVPVGAWDIMATESTYVQYPLAYMRYYYNKWISIPTIEGSRQGLSLYAASATTEKTKDQQALILKTDYSDTEFFVVEYRKKGQTYTSTGQYSQDYEAKLPGSGLIIYRVNTAQYNNFVGPPDLIYVFRPGDEYDANGYESGKGDMTQSYLSLEAKRTQYGSSDFSHTLTDGAITYSDGTNSGIIISNVGSASGEQITFDITFAEKEEGKYWTTYASEEDGASTTDGAAYLDTDGAFYHILKKGSVTSGTAYFYRQKNGSFTRLGMAPAGYDHILLKYDGSFYTAYMDSSYKAALARWNGSSWTVLHQSSTTITGISLTSDEQGVYMAYTDSNGAVYAWKVTSTSTRATALGSNVGTSNNYPANPSIAAENGKLVVMYREAFNNNLVVVKQYNSSSNSWSNVGSQSFRVSSGSISLHEGRLYLVNNGASTTETSSYLYSYDLEKENSSWTQVGTGPFTTVSVLESDLCFVGDEPYIVYTDGASPHAAKVTHILEGAWTQLGDDVAKVILNSPEIHVQGEKIYISFINTVSQKAFIKMNLAQNEESVLEKEACQIVDKGAEAVDGRELFISDEGLTEPLTDLQLIRMLERQASKGPFESISIHRTGNETYPLEKTISANVFNAALFLLKEGGELQFVLQDQTPAQEEVTILTLVRPREAGTDINASITIREVGGKQTLSIAAADFPAERVSLSYEADRLADVWESRLEASDGDSLPLYYYEDTADGERSLVTIGSCSHIAAEGSDSGRACRLTVEEAEKLAADTAYTIESTRYDWRLEYGHSVSEGTKIPGNIFYYTSEEALLAALNGVTGTAGTNVSICSVGEAQPDILRKELLKLCADRGWTLEYARKEADGETEFIWRFTGLREDVEYGDYSLEIEMINEGASLPLEYAEKAYILLTPKGVLPFAEAAQLYIRKENIAQGFMEEEAVYQWNQTGERLTLEGAAEVDKANGNRIKINLSGQGEEAYLLSAQGTYGWIKVTEGEGAEQKEVWTYLEHRTGKRVTGWGNIEGKTYYFNQEGYLAQGPTKIEEKWYLFGQSQDGPQGLLTGLQQMDGKEYYASENGILMSGWQKLNNSWYYFSVEDQDYGVKYPSLQQGCWVEMLEGSGGMKGQRYYFKNNSYLLKNWQTIEGERYFFTTEGYVHTGWYPSAADKNAYYFNELGQMQNGYRLIEGDCYFFHKNGKRLYGWQKEGQRWHYFEPDGTSADYGKEVSAVYEGDYWYDLEGTRYYFKNNTKLATGWQTIDNSRYYFDSQGRMCTGTCKIGSSYYHFYQEETDEHKLGVLAVGEFMDAGEHYYAAKNGSLKRGWQKLKGEWKYFDAETGAEQQGVIDPVTHWATVTLKAQDGETTPKYFYFVDGDRMANGWQKIGEDRYYFDVNGVLQSGFFGIGQSFYYGAETGNPEAGLGRLLTGEQLLDGKTYYFGDNGVMYMGFKKIDGKWRYFTTTNDTDVAEGEGGLTEAERGKALPGSEQSVTGPWIQEGSWYWYTVNGKEYCFKEDKTLLKGWQTISGNRYYLDPVTGAMAKNTQLTLGRQNYYLDENGVMVRDKVIDDYGYNRSGYQVKGWQTIEGKTYYFDTRTGTLQKGNDEGLLVLGKNTYRLDEKGALCQGDADGLLEKDGNTYLTAKNGALQSGWQKVGKDWYYFSQKTMEKVAVTREYTGNNYLATIMDDGEEKTFYFQKDKPVTGWQTVGDERLYFDPATGEKQDGLFKAGRDWYYLENGEPVPGWWENKENTAHYYFDQSGKAMTGWQTIEGEKYFFNSNGVMQVQKIKVGNNYYFFGTQGSMRIGFVRYLDSTYYFNEAGQMETGWQSINGKTYYFDSQGVLLPSS